MSALYLALKDLTQILRDWKSALYLVLMPVAFTLFFGLAFGAKGGDQSLAVGLVDLDEGGSLSTRLAEVLEESGAIRILKLEAIGEAEAQVLDGTLAAVVVVPPGFSGQALSGEAIPLQLTVLPGSRAGQLARTAIEAGAKRLLGAVEAARLGAEVVESGQAFETDAGRLAHLDRGVTLGLDGWRPMAIGVVAEPATASARAGAPAASGFVQSSPGMIVMFAIFGLITSSTVLVLERKQRTHFRLLVTPTRPSEILAGHGLAMLAVALGQEMLLVALGQLLLGVDYLRVLPGTLLTMIVLAFWATSLGLLVGAVARGEEQVILLSLMAMFVFAGLGGAWFPLEVAGQTFAAIGHLLPTAWAMDGFQNLVHRGLGFESTLVPAGVLLGYALGFFGLAAWRFR